MSNREGGRDTVHNIGMDPQLQIMERFGELMSAACSGNLRFPMAVDGRDI